MTSARANFAVGLWKKAFSSELWELSLGWDEFFPSPYLFLNYMAYQHYFNKLSTKNFRQASLKAAGRAEKGDTS